MDATSPARFPATRSPELTLRSDVTWRARQNDALADVREGLRLWRLAVTLGWFDIRLRYRGSLLGPFWLTLSTAVMIVALGFLYSALFRMNLHEYLPYLSVSLVLWNFIGAAVAEACTAFLGSEGLIRSVRLPFTAYAGRVMVRNLLVLGHNVLVFVAVYAWFDMWPGWAALGAIPGLLLWLVDGLAACLLLGAICARFRDIPPIVGSLMQIAFFITPVIWKPELLSGARLHWLPFNPFYPLLEVVRAPLLGGFASHVVWAFALGYSMLLMAVTWALFVRVRGRLAFWV